jgi:hypothetical protein
MSTMQEATKDFLKQKNIAVTGVSHTKDGAAELTSRRDLALEWFDKLEAPHKQLFTFENAAHSVAFEGFESVHKIMLETVLPETYQQGSTP